jgi:hypothetical protein
MEMNEVPGTRIISITEEGIVRTACTKVKSLNDVLNLAMLMNATRARLDKLCLSRRTLSKR